MITIRKHAQTGLSGRVGTRSTMAMQSLAPTLAKLVQKTTPMVAPTKKCRQNIATDIALSAGMRRIYEQHRAGKYVAADYSIRTAQRHRKFFLSMMGIDLRHSYCPSATDRVSRPKPLAKQRTQSVPNKKNKMKRPPPAPEPVSASSDKSRCASDALARVRSSRALRKSVQAVGLGAMARRPFG